MTEQVRNQEPDRYARQRVIPGWDQSRLAAATVVLAGVGALGNEVAKNLALAGVGKLVLCDPDVVSVSNLSRTVLFKPSDVDTPKATAAGAALRAMAPGVATEARFADLVTGVGLGELADADVVIGCVDTIRARVQLLGRCALAGAPLLDGGTTPWQGEIRVRLDVAEACYGCTLTAGQRSVSDLPWSCIDQRADEREQASAIATTALVGGWLTSAALGIMFADPPPYRMLTIDAPSGRAEPITLNRDPTCPLHRPLPLPIQSTVDNSATVTDFLDTLSADDEPHTWNQFPLDSQRRTSRLRDADPSAVLSALGVAPQEILPVFSAGGDLTCHRLK